MRDEQAGHFSTVQSSTIISPGKNIFFRETFTALAFYNIVGAGLCFIQAWVHGWSKKGQIRLVNTGY